VFGRILPFLAVAAAAYAGEAAAFLERTCAGCHQGSKPAAGLDLKALPERWDDAAVRAVWVRVHDAVARGAMPPGGAALTGKQEFLTALGQQLRTTELARRQTHGRAMLRRLNRYEFENSLRDLLQAPWLELRDSLPEDGLVQRLNKSGQALDISHVQIARYMETADAALRQVLASNAQPPAKQRYYARDQKRLQARMRYTSFNRHPERATIPVIGYTAQPEVLAEKAPFSDPKTRDVEAFVTPASTYTGNEYHFDQFTAGVGGRYQIRFSAYTVWIGTEWYEYKQGDRPSWWRPLRERTSKGRTTEPVTLYAFSRGGEKRLLGSFDVTPEPAEQTLTVHLLPGESILPDASRLFRSRPGFIGSPDASAEGMPGVAYRWMEVEGPFPNAAPALPMPTRAEEVAPLLNSFLDRAYRRPPTAAERQRYLAIAQRRLETHPQEWTEAMLAAYTAILCSPGFLFLEEQPGRLPGAALASRLSYFLSNGPPDAELRALADNGRLLNPSVLRAQTERLLRDPKSTRFFDAFLDYWLDLRKVGDTTPDVVLYPDYYLDDLLVESAVNETRLFFAEIVQKNLPARTLLDADFTILNSHLAKHYGIGGVDGVAMRRVALPPGNVRGGLLTQASVLKVTANGTTTSPVLRGVWIQERLLGDPPPPPPPGTPAVEPDTRGATTIRQQLEQHRSIRSCAVCHNKIDPPGFALENFDVLGGWRERYRSTAEGDAVKGVGKNGHAFAFRQGPAVDASAVLASGERFADVKELKRLLAANDRQIARNLVQQLLVYATGSPAGFADRAAVERILQTASASQFRVRSLIHEIVQSELFRSK
jgi:hypothetical protein